VAPRVLYSSVPQIDRRKAKGRNERGSKRKLDRSNQSLTCSTNRTPVLALYEAKPIGPYVSLFGQFTSSRALRISITDRLGGYRFRLILKNGPKPLREISCEREREAIAEEFSRRAYKYRH